MSSLILPPGVEPPPRPKPKAKRFDDSLTFEPYYSELPKIQKAAETLNRIFAWSGEEPHTEAQYETTARNLFGDAGFEIAIEWMQAMDPEDLEELPFKVPSVMITGRVQKEEERDHERLKYEIQAGMADGQPGVIREDGSKREDPIRKSIY
jgi:hypothetical protein